MQEKNEEYELERCGERNLKLLSPSRCRSRYYQDLLVKSSLERVASSLQGLQMVIEHFLSLRLSRIL